jgi:hypothetical protein
MLRRLVAALLALACAVPVLAADDIASGPKKDDTVPTLTIMDVTGPNKGKELDIVKDRGDKPTVYLLLWADKFSRPMNRYMKTLDDKVTADFKDVAVVAVWLTEDAEKTAEFLPRVQQSVKYSTTALTFNKSDKNGPNNWGINNDAHLTTVIASKGKVAATFAYGSVNETDVPKVLEALKKTTGK